MKYLKATVWWFFITWPYGYLCQFEYGELQVRVTKKGWVIMSDGQAEDALPAHFVSQKLIDRIKEELKKKWYCPEDDDK